MLTCAETDVFTAINWQYYIHLLNKRLCFKNRAKIGVWGLPEKKLAELCSRLTWTKWFTLFEK